MWSEFGVERSVSRKRSEQKHWRTDECAWVTCVCEPFYALSFALMKKLVLKTDKGLSTGNMIEIKILFVIWRILGTFNWETTWTCSRSWSLRIWTRWLSKNVRYETDFIENDALHWRAKSFFIAAYSSSKEIEWYQFVRSLKLRCWKKRVKMQK